MKKLSSTDFKILNYGKFHRKHNNHLSRCEIVYTLATSTVAIHQMFNFLKTILAKQFSCLLSVDKARRKGEAVGGSKIEAQAEKDSINICWFSDSVFRRGILLLASPRSPEMNEKSDKSDT